MFACYHRHSHPVLVFTAECPTHLVATSRKAIRATRRELRKVGIVNRYLCRSRCFYDEAYYGVWPEVRDGIFYESH